MNYLFCRLSAAKSLQTVQKNEGVDGKRDKSADVRQRATVIVMTDASLSESDRRVGEG